ncbi:HflK protein [Pacificimonas flava]|uniref:Protein HflK n=2 Tax=Pacificimonas TaxID=1960290 RepID=A0A219B541_9SPHN|nr:MULTISPECIES: FtsH protease activity modulator HflK [Pacificimonas]MBZ6377033.1 FtsH protease activity modulator HflK [Pacificimonas aurantium]OWV33226.1 HflK protein [Pacificimonas flava]
MPWQNNEGGPWGSGDGGDKPRNPWGQKPEGGKQKPSRGSTDFDDFIRRSQERLRSGMGGGNGGGGGGRRGPALSGRSLPWTWIIVAIIVIWVVATSIYRVEADEQGVEQMFGQYYKTTQPGTHIKWPSPIVTVTKPRVEQVNEIEIGSPTASSQNLMLTSDQNIIDIAYTVRWKIDDPENFLFQFRDPEQTIREVAESAMRSVVASVDLDAAIGPQREQVASEVEQRTQAMLNEYGTGVDVVGVDIRQADPPAAVDEAFKDVSAAQQNAEQYINQARAYNQQLIAQARGQAAAFDAVYQQYRLAPEVTRKRMYFETMEQVLRQQDKTILEADGVVPYLPLDQVNRQRAQQQGGNQ